MQGPGGDLVSRIIALYQLHAPAALERLGTAIEAGETGAIAEQAHALKSLCRNIGAQRLGDILHDIESDARDDLCTATAETLELLQRELDCAFSALAEIEAPTSSAEQAA